MARARSVHFFAGAGGDTIAAEMAGIEPALAANHWTRAIDTHATNYPKLDHVVGDLAVADPKKLPKGFANYMFASPECDGHSSARNHRQALRRLRPWDPKTGIERSRCTMWCPQRWAAVHRFEAVIMENVVDVCRWRAFPDWVKEWDKLGYRLQLVFANSAVFGAPQSRDRVYPVATLKSLPEPDLDFRPPGWCWSCEKTVDGIQTWKKAALKKARPWGPVGKYGARAQYVYRCPACNQTISPWVPPAWTAIDWSLPATRIRDRDTPLKPATIARIERGLVKLGYIPQLVPLDRINDESKHTRPAWLPAPTLTGRQDSGLMVPDGFQLVLRGVNRPLGFDEPAATVAASGNHTGLVTTNESLDVPREPSEPIEAYPAPELVVQVGGNTFERGCYARAWSVEDPMVAVTANADKALFARPDVGEAFAVANYNPGHLRDVTQEPMGTLTAGGQHGSTQQAIVRAPREAMLASYYRTGGERSTREPMGTLTSRDRHALVEPPHGFMVRSGGTRQQDIVDCRAEPSATRMPTENYGVARPAISVEDCTFRMIEPEECQRVMSMDRRFVHRPDGTVETLPFKLTGPKRDRVKLSGNGVTPQVEAAISDRCLAAQRC